MHVSPATSRLQRPPTPVPPAQPAQILRDKMKRRASSQTDIGWVLPETPQSQALPYRPKPTMPPHIPTGVLGVVRWLMVPRPVPDDIEACRKLGR